MAGWSPSGSNDLGKVTSEDLENMTKIGNGGCGIVYKAKHKIWTIDVAVKCLLPNLSDESALKKLLEEARMMRHAQFQFVLPVCGYFKDKDDNLGVVVEFMPHGSIAGLLERLEPPWSLRFRLLHEVALAMNYLHSLSPQLLHLDLKPQNVLLDGDLHAKVADFGLSKFKKTDATRLANNMLGTQEYMPPESLQNINHQPNTAFDVYSYAIVIWSMLTRNEPYKYAHPDLIKYLVPEGQRPDMEKIAQIKNVAGIAEYVDLMKLCWNGDQSERPGFRVILEKTKVMLDMHKHNLDSDVLKVKNILQEEVVLDDIPHTLIDSGGMTMITDEMKSFRISEEETIPAVGRPQIRDIGTPHAETIEDARLMDTPIQQSAAGRSYAQPDTQRHLHRDEGVSYPSYAGADPMQPQGPAGMPYSLNYAQPVSHNRYTPAHPEHQSTGQYNHQPTSGPQQPTSGPTPSSFYTPSTWAPANFFSPTPYHPAPFSSQPTNIITITGSNLKNTQIGNNNKIIHNVTSRRHPSGVKKTQNSD